MKKYILVMMLGILFIIMTWTVQEGMKDKKDKKDIGKVVIKGSTKGAKKVKESGNSEGKSKTKSQSFDNDLSYSYVISTNDDWNINQRTIQGILDDLSQERFVILYPIGTSPKKLFSFIDEQYPPTGPRIRLVILYNPRINVLSPMLNILEIFETSDLKQSLFIYAKGSDKVTKKIGNITPL
jgi:hypothetical protein